MVENEKSPVGIFDSHAHYFDTRFREESEGADRILAEKVFGAGIGGVVNVGTNPENSRICIRQAKGYANMYVAVGIHPEDCQALSGEPEAEVAEIAGLMDCPEKRVENKIVALGEIGLDYHGEQVDKERQAAFFSLQMELAEKYGLPVIIHDRDAHGDCFETVLRYPGVRGVFHSFSGSAEMARELVHRGWYISFSGVVSFQNARKVREVAAVVPADRILVETDCPYLAPVPFRGKLNHSGFLPYTVAALADARGVSYEEIVRQTAENAIALFFKGRRPLTPQAF